MASSNTRQRKLARAKVDRQMVRRAEQERRSRQLKAVFGGLLAIGLVGVLGAWSLGAFDAKPVDTVAEKCPWGALDTAANTSLKDVGKPAASGMPESGTSAMTIAFGTGTVVAELDRTSAPCGAASLKYLADSGFYNDTKCHELTHGDGSFALACGDPSGTGTGGAAYSWWNENPPVEGTELDASAAATPSAAPSASAAAAPKVRYPAGTVAMSPGLNGSQFLIFYQDSTVETNYSIVGKLSSGIDVIRKIAQGGTVANPAGADTKPKQDVVIKTLTVVDNTAPASPSAPAASPAPSGSAPAPKPSASAPKPSASASAAS